MKMTKRDVSVCCVLLILIVCTVAVSVFSTGRKVSESSAPATGGVVSEDEDISAHRKWTRVNPEPVMMLSFVAGLCRAPTAFNRAVDDGGPHKDKFITVYVNEVGRHAMMLEERPKFPQGSIIVKEKLPAKNSASPELLTAMVKREEGFNPASGDWEYLVLNGSGTEVQARGRLENCMSCHVSVKGADFVFRNYLPPEVWEEIQSRSKAKH